MLMRRPKALWVRISAFAAALAACAVLGAALEAALTHSNADFKFIAKWLTIIGSLVVITRELLHLAASRKDIVWSSVRKFPRIGNNAYLLLLIIVLTWLIASMVGMESWGGIKSTYLKIQIPLAVLSIAAVMPNGKVAHWTNRKAWQRSLLLFWFVLLYALIHSLDGLTIGHPTINKERYNATILANLIGLLLIPVGARVVLWNRRWSGVDPNKADKSSRDILLLSIAGLLLSIFIPRVLFGAWPA
jgi:succinate dehydrogenase hydrophobic anchor subunit